MWVKKCMKILVMLFKNRKHVFKLLYQMAPNCFIIFHKTFLKIVIKLVSLKHMLTFLKMK